MTRVPVLGKDKVRTRFTRSKRLPRGNESPAMCEAQVATHSPGQGEANRQARVTRSRGGPSGDQCHQVNGSLQEHHSHQVQIEAEVGGRESSGPVEAKVCNKVIMAK